MRLERFRFRAMGTICALQLWGPSRDSLRPHVEACLAEILRLERKYSRYRDDSLATRINRSAGSPDGIDVDDETAALLDFAATAHAESGGRFDPTSGVLRRVWDFRSGRRPDRAAIDSVLGRVGWSKLRWSRPRLVLPVPGMELDFGGFVKEYAADRLAELCRGRGLSSGLVDLGGDLAVVGPHPDASPWRIGIRDPFRPGRAAARTQIDRGGLATSGDYERCMVVDGIRYSHLLDPRTGESFRGGPACVSTVASHCLIAGVAATVAMLHPEDEAASWLAGIGLPHLVIGQSGAIRGLGYAEPPPTGSRTRSASQPSSPSRAATAAASTIESSAIT